MEKFRTVSRLLFAEEVDMGGFPVKQPFPTQQVAQIDPFLLLHHAEVHFPEYLVPSKAGIGPHPHRGFAPVTFVFKGGVHHRDSRGNNSTIYEGGTQWMSAGRGIVHSERPPHDIQEKGGVQEIIQLWINLPKAHKMDQPVYIPLTAAETPTFTTGDGNVTVQVVAGEFEGVKGPVKPVTPVLAVRLTFKQGGKYAFSVPENYNAFLYLLDGSIRLAGFGLIEGKYLALLNNDGTACEVEALEDTRMLLMAGEPIGEEVVSHGPFVMNTQSEILQAMRDYQLGKFGILIED
ncbi:MAG: pirin family protein [Hymenobacteraceae bacterium]|nr:pirin family protein [Hymenobacteraceae bacterium]MDX5395692.1 pirin family protein [Hymenobacteraceae bacterium]MDX5442407.1 pirin family protein [Hymenobacteraceae bacterium]MDX5511746.1 pirin family protein [Hymenobacteraceae bacterium]